MSGNSQINDALVTLLQQTTQTLNAGTGFVQTQLPEALAQLLWWETVVSFFYCLCSLLVFGALLYEFKTLRIKSILMDDKDTILKRRQRAQQAYEDGEAWAVEYNLSGMKSPSSAYREIMDQEHFSHAVWRLGVVVLSTIPLISVIANLTWIKILLVPKYYLLQYAADLVK